MDIFLDKQDYDAFMLRLQIVLGAEMSKMPFDRTNRIRLTPCPARAFSLICYCLMPNHWHLVIEQKTELPISTLMLRFCTSYSKYFNNKYSRVGQVFQDQFSAVMIESDQQLSAVSAYIHQNPKVAGLVQNLQDWEYSSYANYIGDVPDMFCDCDRVMANFKNAAEYRDFVENRYCEILERKEIANSTLD